MSWHRAPALAPWVLVVSACLAACGGGEGPDLTSADSGTAGPGLRAEAGSLADALPRDTPEPDVDGPGPVEVASPAADVPIEDAPQPLLDLGPPWDGPGLPELEPPAPDLLAVDTLEPPSDPGPSEVGPDASSDASSEAAPDAAESEPDLPGVDGGESWPDVAPPAPDVVPPAPDASETQPDIGEPTPDVAETLADAMAPEVVPWSDAPGPIVDEAGPELPGPEPELPGPEPELPPDPPPYPEITLEPAAPAAGQATLVRVWDTEPWANVGVDVAGPCGGAEAGWVGVDAVSPGVWRWTFEVAFPSSGAFDVTFTRDSGVVVIAAAVQVSGPSWCLGDYPQLEVAPATPIAGATAIVSAWDTTPWGFVGLTVTGPCGGAEASWVGVDQVEPGLWRWQLSVAFPAAGTYALAFTGNDGATPVVDATVQVAGTVVCPGDPPPDSPFGTVVIGPGSDQQLDLARDLVGAGGHITMILAGVTPASTGPDPSWVAGIQGAYDRDLVPVLRLGPPWGQLEVRAWSDDSEHLDYTTLAGAYQAVVAGLPLRDGWPLYIQVHNEPNLCHEWRCTGGGWLDAATTASEYAHFFADVAMAIHDLGEPRIQVAAGALAAGGASACACCDGDGCAFEGGQTGLDFMGAMEAALPDVWTHLDFLASHAFPAEGIGWGFFVPYGDAWPGLTYFQQEQVIVGMGTPTLITETGWSTARPVGGPFPSEQEMADWTVAAYQSVWAAEPTVIAACPFLLMDPIWGDAEGFGWVWSDGTPRPVYEDVRVLRCGMGLAGACP